MISIITGELKKKENYVHGGIGRYSDFFCFLDSIGIKYGRSLNDVSSKRIYDSNYFLEHKHKKNLDDSDILAIASCVDIVNLKTFPPKNYLIHNLWMANKLKIGFLPMFGYSDEFLPKIKSNSISKKKYGIYFDIFDGNYHNFFKIIDNVLGKENVMILSKNTFPFEGRDYLVTNSTEKFLKTCENVIDFSDNFAGRHVMSRFYIECFLSGKKFFVINRKDELPNLHSLFQFEHIRYELVDTISEYNMYKVIYDKKYFRTDSYKKYIIKCFETEIFTNFSSKYVEELSDV